MPDVLIGFGPAAGGPGSALDNAWGTEPFPCGDPAAVTETCVGPVGSSYTLTTGKSSTGANGTGACTYAVPWGNGVSTVMFNCTASGGFSRKITIPGGAVAGTFFGTFSVNVAPASTQGILSAITNGTTSLAAAINSSGQLLLRDLVTARWTSNTVVVGGAPFTVVYQFNASAQTCSASLYDQYGNLLESSGSQPYNKGAGTVDSYAFGAVAAGGGPQVLCFSNVGFIVSQPQTVTPAVTTTPPAQPLPPDASPFLSTPFSFPAFTAWGGDLGPVGISTGDTGAGADAQTLTATETDADTGAGADAQALTATETGADTGSGADAQTLTDLGSDTGTGADAQTVTDLGSDTGSGAESQLVEHIETDTGSGADAQALTATETGTDTGAGAEGQTAGASAAGAESGSGAEGQAVAVSETSTETGTGAEGQGVSTTGASADTGAGVEGQLETAHEASADTGAGTETTGLAVTEVMVETGSATEAEVISQVQRVTETGSSTDAESVRVLVVSSDTGHATDLGYLRFTQPLDTGLTTITFSYTQPTDQGVTEPL